MAMMWSLQRSQDSLQFLLGWKSVCLHIKPFFVLTDIQPNQVSALILHPINREVQALWSQSYDTGSYVVPGRQQFLVVPCNAVVLGYDRPDIHTYASCPDTLIMVYTTH